MDTIPVTRAPQLCGARALFTTRAGGISRGEHESFNLARHVGDDPAAVEHNRSLLAQEMGAPLVFVQQVHGTTVHVLGRDTSQRTADSPADEVPTADALVTDRDDIALAIMVADCMPVLLSDPEAGVIGAAHAGRRGLLDGILVNTVEAMTTLGAKADGITAVVGPSACGSCYEVPEAMREESRQMLSAVASQTSWGTPALDLWAGARQSLEEAGVPAEHVHVSGLCTLEDHRFFSYRRSQGTGRFAGVIRALPRRP